MRGEEEGGRERRENGRGREGGWVGREESPTEAPMA